MSAINRPKPTYFQSIVIFSIVLFLIGLFLIITVHVGNISKILKENINLVVELQDELSETELFIIQDNLKKDPIVIPSSITYVGKEEALEIMKEEMGETLLLTGEDNPFYDIIKLNIKSEFQSQDKINEFVSNLKNKQGVIDAYYYEDIYEGIEKNLRKVSYMALIAGIIFFILAYTLIHNTLQISLHADKEEIRTMELVGAEWSFIKKPYVRRNLVSGLISALISIALLAVFMIYIHLQIYDLSKIVKIPVILGLASTIIILAVAFNWISTHFILKKYLGTQIES